MQNSLLSFRLNFRKPREPVGNYSTMGGSDLRAAHISLAEMSGSRDTAPRSKVSLRVLCFSGMDPCSPGFDLGLV